MLFIKSMMKGGEKKNVSEWEGNEEVFRAYFHGKLDTNGDSVPSEKIKDKPGHQWKEVCNDQNFGAVLNDSFIDISFDSQELSDSFWKMADENGWYTLILTNPTNGHIHSFWKIPKDWTFKDGKNKKLSVGLIADIHSGSTYIRLRVNGVDRFPPDYEPDHIQEVPKELYPVNSNAEPFGMSEGGRNDTLSRMAKNLIHNTRFTKEQIKRILTNTNVFVFNEPLSDSELDVILRDETFEDMQERKLNTMNAAELFNIDVKPTEFIINGLIPVGLSLVASPPKYGKSWMMLDMSISVSEGNPFLGFTTNKCNVLYLALEDRFDRLKDRMLKITDGKPFPAGLEIAIDAPALGDGFIEYVGDFLNDHLETKLIIIDTFVKIRGIPNGKEAPYALDSREAGILKKFADQHGVAIVLVTHTRKSIDTSDPVSNITGTFGVAGAADDMIILTKEKRSDALTKMSVTGRDVAYEEYPIVFNQNSYKWVRQGESYELAAEQLENEKKYAEYLTGNIRKTLLKLLEENEGIWQGRCNEILDKSREYGTPIDLTSQGLGKELTTINEFLYNDKIVHTGIDWGSGSKKHKFENI
ncbi:MAG: AAA family ATPase [Muricoprocola sp.]